MHRLSPHAEYARCRLRAARAAFGGAALFGLIVLLPSGCETEPEEVSVRNEMTAYMDQARLWAATEAEINTAISRVREDQFVHDDLVIDTLRPAVGVAHDYVAELEAYVPNTPALVSVHQGYVEAWRAHEFALASVLDAVERKDYVDLSRANTELLEAQRSVSDVLAALARLLREAGVASETPPDRLLAPPEEFQGFQVDPKR